MRKVPKIKTMCSRQDFLFTGCRTFQSVYFTPNFHTTFELQGLKEPFNPVPDFSTRFPNCSNKNLSLKSSQNKKDLNDVTAVLFSVFSCCWQLKKRHWKRGNCDVIKVLLILWRLYLVNILMALISQWTFQPWTFQPWTFQPRSLQVWAFHPWNLQP